MKCLSVNIVTKSLNISKEGLKKHNDLNHRSRGPPEPLFCDTCNNGQKYKSKETLKKHIKSQHCPVEFYKCNRCPSQFTRKFYLQNHIDAVHEEKKPYECPLCDIGFSQKSQLKTHTDKIHDQGMSTCHFCDERFELVNEVKIHIQEKHSKTDKKDVKPFKCKICDLAYGRKAYLKKHNETHVKNP